MTNLDEQSEKLNQLGRESGLIDEVTEILNNGRPKIRVPGDQRELIDFCRECAIELAKEDRLFRRDRTPIAVNRDKARLNIITPRAMRSVAQRYIEFIKFKTVENEDGSKTTQTVVKNIAAETAGALLESWLVDKLPEVRRVNPTRLPAFRDDGRIELCKPGYFADQGIYTFDDGIEYDETMTRDQAVAILKDLLKDFPFLNERSKAVAIAAILTMFCATMLPKCALRPGFIYTANAPGAGKTLLCKFAIIPVTGGCSVRTLPRKEETRKVLDSLALDASIYILFDNIRGKISGEEIEAFITSAEHEGRLLGESTRFRVDNVATVFLTGNDSSPSAEMAERCLFVELFIPKADNRDRVIPRIIDDDFLAEPARRSQILSALWALVRAWEADGKPKPSSPPIQHFEKWSEIVAGIVEASGFGDPLEAPEILFDIKKRDMAELVKILAPIAKDVTEQPWKFDQIIEQIQEHGLFEDAEIWQGRQRRDMFDKEGITSAGKSFFGKLLVSYDQRLFRTEDGRRLRFGVIGKGNSRRYLVTIEL